MEEKNHRAEEIVFYSGWFKRYQSKILWLANSWFGRKLLRIDGDRSDVGNHKIFKIEPHAIHWKDGEECKAEFRTHAKFAKRLYYGLKPLWYAMHFYDWLIGERELFPKLNEWVRHLYFKNKFLQSLHLLSTYRLDFGFETLTKYPDANPESTTVDGAVYHNESLSFSSLRGAAGSAANDSNASGAYIQITSDWTTDKFNVILRSLFLFDTSSLTSSASIISAILSLYGSAKVDARSWAPNINIYSSAPASNTALAAGDYDSLGTTAFSTAIAYASWNTSGYNNFTLNSSGLAAISKTSITKFGARNANYDVANSAPSSDWVDMYASLLAGYFADQTGTANDPKLVVTYGIPATVTNSVSFEVEDDIPLTISNPSSLYLKYYLYVGTTLIKSGNMGAVTSYTITLTGTDDQNIYAEMPSSTSASMSVQVKSYLESSYTTQVGSTQTKTGTVTIDQVACKPTFTAVTSIANLDKNVVVKDKYDNTLVTSSTSTLLGSDARMIAGYSNIRATIEVADKAVALNQATMSKYRMTCGSAYVEAAYSAVATVNLDIDNALVNAFTITAYDSRNLTTAIAEALDLLAEYTACNIYSAVAVRDNLIEDGTKLQISGAYWNKYFGSNTTSDPGSGQRNSITAHYRYKETTAAWGAQTWTAITLTDTDGALSYDDYIDGDLGASGFDPEKSYNIEVRIYDKLSQDLVEITLDRGQPVMDWTQEGVAFGDVYDTDEGGSVQIDGQNFLNYPTDSLYRNAIINGNFDIWQRGTSAILSGSTNVYGYCAADRWWVQAYSGIGGSPGYNTLVITKESFSPGQTDVPHEPSFFHRFDVTVGTKGTSFAHLRTRQRIESVKTFAGETVTLSFYAKADSARTCAVGLQQNFGTGGSPDVILDDAQTFDLTTSWQRFEMSFDIPSISGKTIGTGSCLALEFCWYKADDTVVNTGNGEDGTWADGVFDLAQVQLNYGKVALNFVTRSYAEELRLCQRYFFYLDMAGSGATTAIGYCRGTSDVRCVIPFPVEMRNSSQVLGYHPNVAGYYGIRDPAGNQYTMSSMAIETAHTSYCALTLTPSGGMTAGYAVPFISLNGGKYLSFDCEL